MTLTIPHFDPQLRVSLEIEQKINGSLAEYLFPDTRFQVGIIDPDSTIPEDLYPYEGKSAQFANGKRIYFADKPLREQVYPEASDGAAYGSILFTPCKTFQELTVRTLIVDDSTGNTSKDGSQNLLPPAIAKNLVGDCHGKISPELAEQLTGSQDTPFQFRLGIKPQTTSPVARIAKENGIDNEGIQEFLQHD